MAYEIHYAYFCHKGKSRYNNEDNYWCCGDSLPVIHEGSEEIYSASRSLPDRPVLAVFDGMGGESCGEAAAGTGAGELGKVYEEIGKTMPDDPKGFLDEASRRMNRAVCAYAREHKISSMGSTMVAAAFGRRTLCLCNLGDSRAYLADGSLTQASVDHVSSLPYWGKAPLIQYLGLAEEESELTPYFREVPYTNGMKILLCTDGLTDMLTTGEIGRILMEEGDPAAAAKKLLEKALVAGGRDNVTAVVCEVRRLQSVRFPKRIWAWLKGKEIDEKQDG